MSVWLKPLRTSSPPTWSPSSGSLDASVPITRASLANLKGRLTGCTFLGVYTAIEYPSFEALASSAALSLPISFTSPCTSTTCCGRSLSRKPCVCGKSACALKLMASTVQRRGTLSPALVVTSAGPCSTSRARVPCTAKSAMMTPLRLSSHQDSNSSRLRPDCSIDGVAMTTQGPLWLSRPCEPCMCLTKRKSNGLASSKASRMPSFIMLMYVW
mmetsp:Transcript_3786/g.11803  ORF Transcript_3786/g.11803 Transcript_3786/m.11803 type:complete len:214 (+) Transcript_3786:604-1245(+)